MSVSLPHSSAFDTSHPRRLPLVEAVAGELGRQIRSGHPTLGSSLPSERELASNFGVSRPVVREALKQLRSRGLVEIRHGVGVRVTNRAHLPVTEALDLVMPAGWRRLLQLAEARLLIEPHVARLAAEKAGKAMLKQLAATQSAMQDAEMSDANQTDAIEHDMQFHRLLAQAAGNDALLLILDAVADLGRESRKVTLSQSGVKLAWEQHQEILAAVMRRDATAASAAMAKHIKAAARDLTTPRKRRAQP